MNLVTQPDPFPVNQETKVECDDATATQGAGGISERRDRAGLYSGGRLDGGPVELGLGDSGSYRPGRPTPEQTWLPVWFEIHNEQVLNLKANCQYYLVF